MNFPSLSLPIHARPLAVNPQSASPLYNGRIPPEIRNALFAAILAEYTDPDPARAYPPNVSRPGYTGPRTLNVALLETCRRVYLETYHLPPRLKTHVFWQAPATGPPGLGARFPDIWGIAHETDYFARFQPWQLARVKEIHIFVQMYWLEKCFAELSCARAVQGIERVKITLRSRDWWYCEHNYPFYINPHRGGGDLESMREEIAREQRGDVVPWEESGWGSSFQNMQALRVLEMEFETTLDRMGEMRTIVERAATWRLPMGERGLRGILYSRRGR
ncbi:hypothetical protein DFH07DRAFT_904230 [Mycena maculata]|uniref:Uncharacterized protein n=1 Tax=Mycena maculata TaxID=230809 RepID=A0AAD7J127_9AGAR|nr:hypothetical protein DFH07DRAFT_904230 [Mycena maculata]